ncbi:MAG: hypothetical protein KVP17_005016 [Porospora cf. gigantea B]|uniref:uncharacterized protein n=1 Tax=Porospora cf. gigantea B TaxID=2853592 RepID=UPI003571E911|nr:MAG: hypothetical protein KVP17_005016 [Porospora cf. gigantea B]
MSKGKGKLGSAATDRHTLSTRAGLTFPVARVRKLMRDGKFARRISPSSAVAVAAILEYMVCELAQVSGDAVKQNSMHKLTPRAVELGIRSDDEFARYLANVSIARSGVVGALTAKKAKSGKSSKKSAKTSKTRNDYDDVSEEGIESQLY